MEHKINLLEALSGFKFIINHLNGKTYIINLQKGDVIKPGDIRMIQELGMPTYRKQYEKGNLFISFQIEFPKQNFFQVIFLIIYIYNVLSIIFFLFRIKT
jgi:DnaJ family protein A protein 2